MTLWLKVANSEVCRTAARLLEFLSCDPRHERARGTLQARPIYVNLFIT